MTTPPAPQPVRPRAIVAGGLCITACFVALVFLSMQRTTYNTWAALFVAPLLAVVSLPAFARQARREADRAVFWLLVIALGLKFAGALARHYVAFEVYGGQADANGYHSWGIRLSERFVHGEWETGLTSTTGTNFMRLLTGIVYTIITPSRLAGFLFFAWLSFWGQYFFYRAFVMSVPEGRSRGYGRLVFLLPSLLFWPSSIGKESWMLFTLGIAAFGVATAFGRRPVRGLAIAGAGLWLAALLRPHVAGMMAVSLAAAAVVRKRRADAGPFAVFAKAITVVAVLLMANLFVARTEAFLAGHGIDTERGLTDVVRDTAGRTGQGGSQFDANVLESPAKLPIAILTVGFRPLLFDAHNLQAAVAAVEGTALLALMVFRFRWLLAALRKARERPYIAFAVAYMLIFIVAFSGFSNFGILSRERVQMTPAMLVLLSVPPGSSLPIAMPTWRRKRALART